MAKYYEYFTKNDSLGSNCFKQNSEKFLVSKNSCFLNDIRKYFDLPESGLTCRYYESVISGEGNEKEKIDSVYSSSLQSFLFFQTIGQNQNDIKTSIKILFDSNTTETFDEVHFEYKNKVIGSPSSIDVVLVNRVKKSICFIESKLLEIVRDSIDKNNKKISDSAYKEVGISYFLDKGNGFYKLNLMPEDWVAMGIGKDINRYLKKVRGKGYGNQEVRQLKGNTFVYPYGIKQVLSHLIGIVNFYSKIDEDHYYKNDYDPIHNHEDFENIYFLELYNDLPGFTDFGKESETKLNNFKSHFNKVKEIVTNRNKDSLLFPRIFIKSYQDLYKNNKSLINDKIKDYYHLEG